MNLAAAADIPNLLASALAAHKADRIAEAAGLYDRILEAEPGQADALHLSGVILYQHGDRLAAIDRITRAIAARPDSAPMHKNLALALRDSGRHSEAVASAWRAVQIAPESAVYIKSWLICMLRAGRAAEAETAARAALERLPDSAELKVTLAAAVRAQKRIDETIAMMTALTSAEPGLLDAWMLLGNAYYDLGQWMLAELAFERAVAVAPHSGEAWNNLGSSRKNLSRLGPAIEAYEKAVALRPDDGGVISNLASTLQRQGRMEEATRLYERAIAVPDCPALYASNYLYGLNFDASADEARFLSAHRDWGRRYADPLTPANPVFDNALDPDKRLRIGYLSTDFCRHAVGHFIRALLRHHDHDKFEIHAFSNVARPDDFTEAMKPMADRWHDVAGMNDEALANLIRAEGIDILVELTGHTADNRLLAVARKPAPIIISWLGYRTTCGMQAIDFRVIDPVRWPAAAAWPYIEKPIVLSRSSHCFEPVADAPPVAPPPAIRNGYVTFGSFNNLGRLNDGLVWAWAMIMKKVPGSRLLLKYGGLNDPDTAAHIRTRFAAHGIRGERLMLEDKSGHNAYLRSYSRLDIALDPFPFHGGATTCDTLWMGVPVVTLAGPVWRGRLGPSLLHAIGDDDLIAEDPNRYIDRAVALARDLEGLAERRRGQRGRMAESPLVDARGYTAELEASYRTAWKSWVGRRRKAGRT